jgi:hypothetical protein
MTIAVSTAVLFSVVSSISFATMAVRVMPLFLIFMPAIFPATRELLTIMFRQLPFSEIPVGPFLLEIPFLSHCLSISTGYRNCYQ